MDVTTIAIPILEGFANTACPLVGLRAHAIDSQIKHELQDREAAKGLISCCLTMFTHHMSIVGHLMICTVYFL